MRLGALFSSLPHDRYSAGTIQRAATAMDGLKNTAAMACLHMGSGEIGVCGILLECLLIIESLCDEFMRICGKTTNEWSSIVCSSIHVVRCK
jgi:hypothetical protein